MGTFEWTTPSRRVGHRALSPLPNEVYLEIFKYFEPSEEADHADCKRILSNLALVCRFFCAVCISRIYRSLEFSGRDASSGYGHFCQLLLKSTEPNGQSMGSDVQFAREMANVVEECTFSGWLPGPNQIAWAPAFLERNARAVRLMPKIEALHLESTPLTKHIITTISKLNKTLKTLSIRSCTLEAELTKAQLQGLDSLRLRDVEFLGTSSSLSPATIRLRDVETFRTDSWTFGLFFMKRQHPALRILELHGVEDLAALFKFLPKCPTITELTVASIVLKFGETLPSLPPTTLLKIQAIQIPPSFLHFFANRSLRHVSLTGTETRDFEGNDQRPPPPILPLLTVKDLAPLVHSASSLTELHVPQHVYFVFPILKHLKNLKVLVLAYEHPNFSTDRVTSTPLFREAVEALCNKWPPSSSSPLRELRLDFGKSAAADARPFMWDLELQRELLSGPLSTAFPRLTTAHMVRFVRWQRGDEQSEWRPFVPHAFRELVRDALARGTQFTDVDDCFAPLDYK
ncbi:hypothetical protein C8R47DRAFT_1323510 [Mycena vitilis]|nr:hypothetical protein C8R47DRAFT_1323510 [Mycena vitilis]